MARCRASSTARTEAMPCTRVQTPQMRWANAQASRGSRPRRMISMPRTMVPAEYALVILPLASVSASMRRCPSMRVMGSTTTRCAVLMCSVLQMFGQQFGQAEQFGVHLVMVEAFLHRDAAVGAEGHHGIDTRLLDLPLLGLEGPGAQRCRLLGVDRRGAAAAAAAPVPFLLVDDRDVVFRNLLDQRLGRLQHPAAAHDLAGVVQDERIIELAFHLQHALLAQLVEQFQHVHDLEAERPPHQVGPLPADRHVGVAALGRQHALHLQPFGGIDDARDDHFRQIRVADLDARVGRLEGVGSEREADAGLVEDPGDRLDVFGVVDDLHRRQQHQVVGARLIDRNRHTGARLGLPEDVGDRRPLQAHRPAGFHRALGGSFDAVGHMARHRHALAELADHVDDVVAHRTDQRAAPAQGAAVVDQFLPLVELRIRHRLRQAEHLLQPAEQRVFLLVDAAQWLNLVDRRVLGIAGLRVEQAGLGAQAAMHAGIEIAGDRRVDDFLQGINGAWLLAVVATQSIATLSALLAAHIGQPVKLELNFLALSMWLWGGMLYIWMMSLIFYRYTFFTLEPGDLSPPYWINMGAMAISTLAGSLLIINAPDAPFLLSLLPFLKGFTVLYWATGTWWIPMLLGLGVWRHVYKRFPLKYDPLYWGAVFPLGMYAVSTDRMIQAMGFHFLEFLPPIFLFIALAAWTAAFTGFVRDLLRRIRAFGSDRPGR